MNAGVWQRRGGHTCFSLPGLGGRGERQMPGSATLIWEDIDLPRILSGQVSMHPVLPAPSLPSMLGPKGAGGAITAPPMALLPPPPPGGPR